MAAAIKLSAPEAGGFWEIAVLHEDGDLLVLDKPPGLPVSLPAEVEKPSLMALLHRGIERGAVWAATRQLAFLMHAHRPDDEVGGVLVLARNKAALSSLTEQFTTRTPNRRYAALVRGTPPADEFETEAKLAPHPLQMGVIRVDSREGKQSRTEFTVKEKFSAGLWLECRPSPDRPCQIRAHLKYLRLPVMGDSAYGGQPLLLSRLKSDYRLKPQHKERPLIDKPALHLAEISLRHPTTGAALELQSPWPKDMTVAVKYLRRHASGAGGGADEAAAG